jgi:hypothetical protein
MTLERVLVCLVGSDSQSNDHGRAWSIQSLRSSWYTFRQSSQLLCFDLLISSSIGTRIKAEPTEKLHTTS